MTGAEIDVPCRISGKNWEEIISSRQTAGVSAPEKEAPAAVDGTTAENEATKEAPRASKKPATKKPTAKKSGARSTTGKAAKK